MNKAKISVMLGIVFLIVLTLNNVSATHATFKLSDSITFREDITGGDRGFSIRRSTDMPRLDVNGFYDWSYRPKNVVYPNPDSYRVSDKLSLEAFKTFQGDSKEQTEIQKLKTINSFRRKHRFGFYGGYNSYGNSRFYGGGYRGYRINGYGGFGSFGY